MSITVSVILAPPSILTILSPVFLILAIAIKIDSKGPVFYRQERVTQYGSRFRIFKFRTMVTDADKMGMRITLKQDDRITRVGRLIRKCRLDEICQLIDVLRGTMTFVGTRPEVPEYVAKYDKRMLATLLLPAGITSRASVLYKDEDAILSSAEDANKAYIEEILPQKMAINLRALRRFGFWDDISVLIMTVLAVLGKKYEDESEPSELTNQEIEYKK